MTRGEALKDFFRKTILPAAVGRAAVLHLPLRLRKERGTGLSLALDPLRATVWGSWRLRLWIIPSGGSLGGGIALFLLNFVLPVLSAAASLSGGCWWQRGMCR